jgi:hypothetical protein
MCLPSEGSVVGQNGNGAGLQVALQLAAPLIDKARGDHDEYRLIGYCLVVPKMCAIG